MFWKRPVHWLSKEGRTFVSSGVKFAAKHSTVTLTMCGGKKIILTANPDLVTCRRCRAYLETRPLVEGTSF